MEPRDAFLWFIPYYLFTIAIETPILLLGLSSRHSWGRRLFCGVWLTACTYPIVFLVLPMLFDLHHQRGWYLLAAETFAPVAECALFWAMFGTRAEFGKPSMWRDLSIIVAANMLSFAAGEMYALLAASGGHSFSP